MKNEWRFLVLLTLFFGLPVAVMMYLAVFQSLDLFVATVLLAFFLLLFGINLWSCVSETHHVRVVPILKSSTPGVRPYEEAPTAHEFLMNNQKGRAIGRYYSLLVEWATQQGLSSLADFGAVSVYDSGKPYYDAQEGLQTVSALIASLQCCLDLIGDPQSLIADLSDVAAVLDEAAKMQMRFCFAIM